MSLEMPSLLYGQTLEVVVKLKGASSTGGAPFRATLTCNGTAVAETAPTWTETSSKGSLMMRRALIRSEIVRFVVFTIDSFQLEASNVVLEETKQRVATLAGERSLPDTDKLVQDLTGQITEAYSRQDWFQRWGFHYLRSLARAHMLQQCTNFKDPGLQTYLTPTISKFRDATEAIFVRMPPPTPSRRVTKAVGSMRAYYNANNPCFASGTVVTMRDRTKKDIAMVRAGDYLLTSNGSASKVQCVVETPRPSGQEYLVALPGVRVTPFHPVKSVLDGRGWEFPCNLHEPKSMECTAVYSLVLEETSSPYFLVGDEYDGVALGHGLTENSVVEHVYLGTRKVIEDLRSMRGWKGGRITLDSLYPIRRDPVSGRIVAFVEGVLHDEKDSDLVLSTTRRTNMMMTGVRTA